MKESYYLIAGETTTVDVVQTTEPEISTDKKEADSENTLNPTFFGEQISKRNSDKNGPIKRLTKQEFGYTWD